MIRMKTKQILVWIFPIAIGIMIFCLSSQAAEESASLSNGLAIQILGLLKKIIPQIDVPRLLASIGTPIRKAAHVTEFLLLFLSLLVAWHVNGLTKWKWIGISFVITFLYACTDEIHQLFIDGRAGMFTDVLIDCSGCAILAVILLLMMIRDQSKGNYSQTCSNP